MDNTAIMLKKIKIKTNMKNSTKQWQYKCKSYRQHHAKRKFRTYISTFIICYTLTTGFMAVNAYLGLTDDITSQHTAISPINEAQAQIMPIPEPSNKDKAIKMLQDAGFDENFIFDFKCLMNKENKQYDEHAVYVNKNLSYDRGLLMWNSKTSPIKISNQCSFDLTCSMNEFINYIKNGGSLDRWFGYVNYCK